MAQAHYQILFLEDSPVDRILYRCFLNQDKLATYHIIEAKSGMEGLKQLAESQPDLILLNYQLQDMDGLEFIDRLRSQYGKLLIPVIILTGTEDVKTAVQAINKGVYEYLIKNKITPERLCHNIHKVLKKSRMIQDIQIREQQKKFLDEILLRIHQFISLEDILPTAVQGVKELLEADRVLIYQFDSEMSGKIVAESVLPKWITCLDDQVQDYCFGKTQKTKYYEGKIQAISDIYNAGFTPCHIQLLEQFQVRANIAVPILLKHQYPKTKDDFLSGRSQNQHILESSSYHLWGLLIVHQCDSIRQWQTQEIEFLEKISIQLAIAIQQAELYQNLQNLNACLEQKVQKRTQELAVSESKYRAIFNQRFQCTGLITLEGIVLDMNQAVLDFSGLQLADVVNRPFWEIHCWTISEATQEQLKQAIARAAQGEFISYEVEILGVNNQIFTIDFSIRPLKNDAGEVVMLIPEGRDITKHKQAEAILKFQAQILEEIHDAVITTDINGIIQSWNLGAQKYYGYTAAETIGQNISILYTDSVELQTKVIEPLLAKGNHEVDLTTHHAKSGDIVHINLRLSVIQDEQGNITHLVGCSNNITKQQTALKERDYLFQQEQTARKQAEIANRMKDEFLGILSHELRTPLNSIVGWTSLLKRGKLKPEQIEEALNIIDHNAKLQVRLINDLLDTSRIFRGQAMLSISPVNLATIISAVEKTLSLAAKTKQIQIQTIIQPNIGLVAGDLARLQQIVWNLLSNAIKFTPHHGQIEVRLERIGTSAQISISDTGKGISPEFLPLIFDYFRQEDSSTTREFGGLGLGLAIVRNLAELHGGTIEADSPGLGQGATFTFRLPLINTPLESSEYNQVQNGYLDYQI